MKRSELKRGDKPLKRKTRMKQVSAKQRVINDERRPIVKQLRAERRACAWPGCAHLGTQPHEPWTRARARTAGGRPYVRHAVTCRVNIVMLCDEHHHWAHVEEEMAANFGLIRRSHEGCPCGFPGKDEDGR